MTQHDASPLDLVMDRLMAFPNHAKHIQVERGVLEDLLREFEEIELENEELKTQPK